VKPDLKLVTVDVMGPEPEDLLKLAIAASRTIEKLQESVDRIIDQQTKRLARKRRVAFIRPEHIRREFGDA
jgi:hypothetical protein